MKQNGALAQYGSAFTTTVGQFDTVPAHTPTTPVQNNGGGFRFKASSQSTLSRDLVRVSVADWETDFDHVTSSHSQETRTPRFSSRHPSLRSNGSPERRCCGHQRRRCDGVACC
ncbi:hypothetical protein ACVBEQ_23435 [Nakamurella sp. GG22]